MKNRFLLTCIFMTSLTGMLQADSNPSMSRVYGAQFTPEVAQTQNAGTIGALDSNFGTSGSLSINAALSGGQAVGIQQLSTGNFLVVLSKTGAHSIVAQYNAEGTLQTSTYGSSGLFDLGATSAVPRATLVDAQGRLLVAGGAASGTAGWIQRVVAAGTSSTTFATSTNWQYVGGLAQQSSGKTIAVGFNGTYAQMARYQLDGTLDTASFGTTGLTILNGVAANTPTVASGGLVSVVIDSTDRIYVAFIASATAHTFTSGNAYIARYTKDGVFDTTWGATGMLNLSALNSATSGLYVANDVNNNFIVAAQVSANVKVTGVTSAGAAISGFTTFNTSTISGNTYGINGLLTSSNGKIYIVGSDTTAKSMSVIRLIGSSGALDSTSNDTYDGFNTTGYNNFNISSPDTTSTIQAISIAPDGELFTVGYQVNAATTVPYVSALYSDQYAYQVAQFPASQEQGNFALSFGATANQTFAGVTSPFNGSYGSSLMQQAVAAVEVTAGSVTHGDIVVGMNGNLNSAATSNMMLSWLTAAGAIDTTVGTAGFLNLANASSSNEYMTSMIQDGSGNLYVAGYTSATPGGASTSAILRVYSGAGTSGTAVAAATPQSTANYQGVGVSLQGTTRMLLCVAESSTVGHITGYATTGGAADTSFGAAGSGTISATSYGLHMGPCYGLLVAGNDDIFAAYVDSSTTNVNVAAFVPNGSALISQFGSAGVVANIFPGYTVAANNVRMGFRKTTTESDNIVVAAVSSTGYLLVASLDPETGALSPDFNGGAILAVSIAGATSLNMAKVTGVSDETIICTFWDNGTDDTMYLARISATGVLDATFNSQGFVSGILPIQVGDKVANYNIRAAKSAIVQSTTGSNQGNIVLVGYESVTSSDSTPIALSVYGDPGTTEIIDYPVTNDTPGTFDVAFDLSTAPVISAGAGNVVFAYPAGNANQGKLLIGIDNGTSSIVARVYATSMALDPTFGTAGKYTIAGSLTGISHISLDSNSNILVGGTKSGAGWAQLLNAAGTTATLFDTTTTATNIAAVNNIYQQQSGRYIVAGTATGGQGILVAFQDELMGSATQFAVDPTFNPLSVGSVPYAGCYYVGTTGLYAIAINTNDTIAVAYAASNLVTLAEITANGSGLVSGFNSGAVITTGVAADSSAVIQLNIDGSGNIVVGASRNNGATHQVQVQRYDSAGGTTTAFTGAGVSGGVQTISNLGTAGVVLSGLMATTTQQTVLVGYNTAGGNGRLFAARLTSTGILDSAWNSAPTAPDTAGVLTYGADSAINIQSGAIEIDGTILSLGSTATGTAGVPILTLIFGDSYVTQIIQNPTQAAAGTLDLTIPGNTSGALALSGKVTGVPARLYIYNTTVNSSPNGAMLVASTDSTHLYVTQLNADLSINSANFGTAGVVTLTPNSGTTPTSVTVTDMYVANGANDTAQPIYVAGYTTNAGAVSTPFALKITSNGDTTTVASSSSLTTTGCIRQSSNSRVFVSGYNGTSGVIVAYNSAMTAIDTSFGNNSNTSPNFGTGYYTTGVNTAIAAMTTDNSDRIYVAYPSVSGTTLNVVRLLENGTGVDTTFSATFTTATTSYASTQVRMAIDLTNNQLIVAARDGAVTGNILQVNRFNLSNGATAGTLSTITVTGAQLALSDLFIDNNSTAGAYPNIYVVGYISAGTGANNSIVARVATTSTALSLDSTLYATTGTPAGVANLSEGAMTVVTAAALNPDRRVYLVGSNGSTSGYMGRFYGDYYWTEMYPAILQAVVGTIDLTLFANGSTPTYTGGINLSSVSGWTGLAVGYKARAIIENSNADGSSFIAFGNNTNLIVGKVNADMVPVSVFGSAGLTTGLAMSTVNSITLDAAGNVVVAGTNSGAQKVVMFNSSGTLIATFAAQTPSAATVGTRVLQQKSGRYIVSGTNSAGNATIFAFQNTSAISGAVLPIDQTFGPYGSNGYFVIPGPVTGQVDDMVIDSNDNIYFVYRGASNHVILGKLTPNGSGLVNAQNSPATFNSGAVIDTAITATQPARIAINNQSYILVGASTSSNITTQLYNGSSGAAIGSNLTLGTSTPVLTNLVGYDVNFYGSFYNSTPNMYAFDVTNTGILLTGFGTGGITTGTAVQSASQVNGLSVQADGKVVMVGYNSSTDPILVRFYGHPYITQYAQAPNQVAAGLLDTTLWPSTGAFLLNNTTSSAFNTAITGYAIKRVYESGNGVMLFVADSGTNTIVFRMNKDLTLDTTFNPSGTPGYKSFTSCGATTGLFVDSLSNIYITGNNGTSWALGMTNTGAALTPPFSPVFNSSHGLATSNQIIQQSGGRLILAGQGSVATGQANTHGYLLAYTNTGAYDLSFGSDTGMLDMGGTTALTDIAIDQYDNIIAVSNNSGTVVLQRATATGSSVASSTGTALTGAVGNIKVILDASQNVVVATATSTGYVLRRYNGSPTVSLTDNAGPVTITSGTTPVLSNIYATSDGKVTLVGYDSTTGNAIVARLTSAFALDTTAFDASGTPGYINTSVGSMNQFYDAIIHADDRIMLVGSNGTSAAPYMGRIFGDTYVTYISQGPTQGVPGTIDSTFGSSNPPTGMYTLSTLGSGALNASQGKAIIALADGGFYMALDNGSNTKLIRTLASGGLDTSYNGTGIAANGLTGVNSMMLDGSGRINLVGTTGSAGWIQQFATTGLLNTGFGSSGTVNLAASTVAAVAVEQTLARLVVAGKNAAGNGALFAYTSLDPLTVTTGAVDTTFNATVTPGTFTTGVPRGIYTLIADQYDRLIFAVLNSGGTAVDLYRLTATGELDNTFGSSGKVAGVISNATDTTQIRVALDEYGNIVIAAYVVVGGVGKISVVSYDNGTSTTIGANGNVFTNVLTFQNVTQSGTGMSLQAIATSTNPNGDLAGNGYVLLLGNDLGAGAGTSPSWIARVVSSTPGVTGGTYALDTAVFNPAAIGGTAGVFNYTAGGGTTTPYHVYNGITIDASGRADMVGYENIGGTITPSLVQIYNDPYIAQDIQSPDSKQVGTNDLTLGVSPTAVTNKGITFYGIAGGAANYGQVAQAIALQDDNNIVVAIDGGSSNAGASNIFINMFDNDGLLNPSFGTTGQQTVLSSYQQQFVRDMVTFTTTAGVHKAILAGYVINSTLGTTDSLVLQYNLSTPGLDSSFGGYDGNPVGIAFGDGKQAFVLGQQTSGRVIVGGLAQNGSGLLLGYTSAGKLDFSFGNDGYQSVNTGSTGIYTHAIDTLNRIVFAYNNAGNVVVSRMLADGSGLDTTFGTLGTVAVGNQITGVTSNSNMKVVVDSTNNVLVAAVTNSGANISLKRYNTAGTAVLQTQSYGGASLGGSSSSVYTLGRLLVDAQDNAVIVAYDTHPTPDTILVTRWTISGGAYILDTNFNTTGYLVYQVAAGNTQTVTDALISPDGRIIVVGSEV